MERLTSRGPPGHPQQVIVSSSPCLSLRAGPGAGVLPKELDTTETKVILVSEQNPGLRLGYLPKQRLKVGGRGSESLCLGMGSG